MRLFRSAVVLCVTALVGFTAEAQDRQVAAEIRTVKGRITQVEPDGGKLTLRTVEGKELKLHLDDKSRLRLHGRDAGLTAFKEGAEVRVTYETGATRNRVVKLAGAPATAEGVKQEIKEALQAAKGYAYRQKDEYQKKLESLLRDLDERIEDLKDQGDEVGAELKKELAREMDELRKAKEVVRDRLKKATSAGAEAWEDVKAGVGAALDDLQSAFERARARFK